MNPEYDNIAGTVHDPTEIISPENLTLPESSRIDSFCLINATGGVTIGDEVHIAAGTKIVGNGGLDADDRTAIAYNSVILTSSANLKYSGSAEVPEDERKSIKSRVTLGRESFIAAGAVVMPGVTIREGAVVAANTYVDDDVPPWTIVLPDGTYHEREFHSR